MVLYSPEAMSLLGGLNTRQMETNIAKEFVETDQAMKNSGISLDINLVHVAQVSTRSEGHPHSFFASYFTSPAVERGATLLRWS